MATELPADGYISDNARDEGEVKQALDDIIAVARRGNVGAGTESLEISAGAIASPDRQVVFVDTEGQVAQDYLTDIGDDNAVDGWILIVKNTSASRTVIVRSAPVYGSGTTRIWLSDGQNDYTLLDFNQSLTLMYSSALGWVEIGRYYGDEQVAERARLNLGDVATRDMGPGNGLDADTVDGQHASEFLGASAQATDSALLEGNPASAFATLTALTQQDFAASIGAPTVKSLGTAVLDPLLTLERDAVKVGELRHDAVEDAVELRHYQDDGVALRSRLRLIDDVGEPQLDQQERIEYRRSDDSDWYRVLHEGIAPLVPVMYEDLLIFVAATVGSTSEQYINLPAYSTFPTFTIGYSGAACDIGRYLQVFWGSAAHGHYTTYSQGRQNINLVSSPTGAPGTTYPLLYNNTPGAHGHEYFSTFVDQSPGVNPNVHHFGQTTSKTRFGYPLQRVVGGVVQSDVANPFVSTTAPGTMGMSLMGIRYVRESGAPATVNVRVRVATFPGMSEIDALWSGSSDQFQSDQMQG